MNWRRRLSTAGVLTVAALLVAAAGFALEIASGIAVATIPPGMVIMIVGAGLVAFLPWRWVPLLGTAVGLFLLFGFFASGAIGHLLDPARLGVLVGSWIQFLALVVAFVAGIAATARSYRRRMAA